MSDNVLIPIAIWKANRERREALKREQELIEAIEAELDEQAEARATARVDGEGRR